MIKKFNIQQDMGLITSVALAQMYLYTGGRFMMALLILLLAILAVKSFTNFYSMLRNRQLNLPYVTDLALGTLVIVSILFE